ncbi:uncharacterized protein LOC142231317 [Haematobia irritans]|uniref:uncharacterized protein LOC142231317 n=1 Tax=Haematobia irritans TaxID=7368 RepID=UPI003F505BF4
MSEILNVGEKPFSDESIIKKDYHSYMPYVQSYKNNDEIRITIQNQDIYVLPTESYIYIEGLVTLADGERTPNGRLRNNCVAHMFDEIRYEINGIEIDRTRHLGISSTIKYFLSLNDFDGNMLLNAGWNTKKDFNKVILNCKHDLILLRSSNDSNVCYSTKADENVKLTIQNITWRIPHVHISDSSKLKVLKIIKDGTNLHLAFRSWDCHFNPTFPNATKGSWNVKLSVNRERPRFVILAFENNKKFIHCHLVNLKVHLNSDTYPYDDLNLKFDDNRYAVLYDMYTKFQQSFYLKEPQPLLSCLEFKDNPISVIDVSYQNEMIKSGPIDVKIEFETSKPIPANTSAYCLIIHDRFIEYTPLTGNVRKII